MYCNFKIIVLINQVKNINKNPILYKIGFSAGRRLFKNLYSLTLSDLNKIFIIYNL